MAALAAPAGRGRRRQPLPRARRAGRRHVPGEPRVLPDALRPDGRRRGARQRRPHAHRRGSFVRPLERGLGAGAQARLVLLVAGVAFLWLRPLTGTLVSVARPSCVGGARPATGSSTRARLLDGLRAPGRRDLADGGGQRCARPPAPPPGVRALRRARTSWPRSWPTRRASAASGAGSPCSARTCAGSPRWRRDRPAEAVAAQLNEYFDAMTRAILAHRGMVNDFVGDAVMATFGAPGGRRRTTRDTRCRARVAMERALAELNRRWEAAGVPTPPDGGRRPHRGRVRRERRRPVSTSSTPSWATR